MQERTREWRPAWPCPAGSILRQQRRGSSDPSYRIDAAGAHWRGVARTPDGPATLKITQAPTGEVHASARGRGRRVGARVRPGAPRGTRRRERIRPDPPARGRGSAPATAQPVRAERPRSCRR
ncbi:hypothetical protein [Nocardioides sp. B-3]|uniref:hypothetical protein n=1 Tax=Nocardioides sp. B-3 TaxID=2895565 RepID=UPI0021524581|nr:hypothetical protein [Nocardioides sp. B-3]UUZ59340.1 hypothetical protein LP418_26415 [Nocardioides sp. B-3]